MAPGQKKSVRFDELWTQKDELVREYGYVLEEANALHGRLSEIRSEVRSLETVLKTLGEEIGTACLPNPGAHCTITDLARLILADRKEPMSVEDLAAHMTTMGKMTTPDSVNITLSRCNDFVKIKPRTWKLRTEGA